MYVYGPVPSRRLGKSLGINNIPHKVCSYSCVYCQVGKTRRLETHLQPFYNPKLIFNDVNNFISRLLESGEMPDYIAIVPDGEPTLDINLGNLIDILKSFRIPIAIITNSSLIPNLEVQQHVMKADYISVKIDSVSNDIWQKINHPHKQLNLNKILEGLDLFSQYFTGILTTETMLVKGMNDDLKEIKKMAMYISKLQPYKAYLGIPTRPPANTNIQGIDEITMAKAFHLYSENISRVELLTTYEGNDFSTTGDAKQDILKISSVHPMREEAVFELIKKTGSDLNLPKLLIEQNLLEKIYYRGSYYYIRKFTSNKYV